MSNLSCIGFDLADASSFEQTMERLLGLASAPAELGAWGKRHAAFVDASGAAVGLHLEKRALTCITPFFEAPGGGTRWRVQTHAAHADHDCADCSGADCDVLDADAQLVTRSAVQFLYFDAYRDWLAEPRTFELQVVGFASALHLCGDEAALEAVQAELFGPKPESGPSEPGKPMRLAPQAFLPYGMFEHEGDLGARARALVTGRLVSLAHPKNGVTEQRFTWARVTTLGGPLDIVAPFQPTLQNDPVPALSAPPDALVLADVWLVGKPAGVAPPPKRNAWLSLLKR